MSHKRGRLISARAGRGATSFVVRNCISGPDPVVGESFRIRRWDRTRPNHPTRVMQAVRPRARLAAWPARTPLPGPSSPGGPVERPAARRPPLRALQPRAGRPAAADPRQVAAALWGAWGGCRRTLSSSFKNTPHAVTALDRRCPGCGADGVLVAREGRTPDGAFYPPLGTPGALRSPASSGFKIYGEQPRSPPASIRSAWSSPTTAADWPRAPTSRSYVDGDKVGRGSRRAHGAHALLRRRDAGPSVVTGATPVSRRPDGSDNAFTGRVLWVSDRRGRGSRGSRPSDQARRNACASRWRDSRTP